MTARAKYFNQQDGYFSNLPNLKNVPTSNYNFFQLKKFSFQASALIDFQFAL